MTRGAWLGALTILLSACGGGAASEPAKSADDVTPTEEREQGEPGDDGGDETGDAPAAPEPASKEGDTADVSSEDRTKILQIVLDDEELSRFLKLGEPGRFPLKVSGADVPSGAMKGGKPVEVVDAPKSEKDAVLVVTRFEIEGKTATVAYRYAPEGIRGTTRVSRGPSGWELKSSRIVER